MYLLRFRLLRAKVLNVATLCHLPEAEEKIKSMFTSWLNSRDKENIKIETDLRDTVYYYGKHNTFLILLASDNKMLR